MGFPLGKTDWPIELSNYLQPSIHHAARGKAETIWEGDDLAKTFKTLHPDPRSDEYHSSRNSYDRSNQDMLRSGSVEEAHAMQQTIKNTTY